MAQESIASLLAGSNNPLGTSIMLLLAWIANCDGEISTEERSALLGVASNSSRAPEVEKVLHLTRFIKASDLQLVLGKIREVGTDQRATLLNACIGVALSDKYLRVGENHALRLIADTLALGETGLASVFKDMTGHDLPRPGDMSSREWWGARQASEPRDSGRQQQTPNRETHASSSIPQRLKDLAMLGLDESASTEDVRSAYKRMAQIHHPDRYATLGAEAVGAAEATFKRIKAAYDRLI